jgi:hypothetical protein
MARSRYSAVLSLTGWSRSPPSRDLSDWGHDMDMDGRASFFVLDQRLNRHFLAELRELFRFLFFLSLFLFPAICPLRCHCAESVLVHLQQSRAVK